MQKKTMTRLAAAAVLGIAVAGTLVWAGGRNSGTSLTYNELLAMVGDSEAAASAGAELKADSSGAEKEALSQLLQDLEESGSSVESSEVESILAALEESDNSSSALAELAASIAASSKEAASSASASSQSASSAVSGASHSTAAPDRDYSSSSQTASSAAHSAASHTSSGSKEKTCDEQLAECVRKMEALQTRSEKQVYGIILDAFDEYMSHPESERNLILKISVVLSKSGELTSAQSKCDQEFKDIVSDMRKILKENGRDQTLADEAEKTYKQKKNDIIKELTDQAYSGGDGSGKSGKWLAQKAGRLT